MNVVLSALTITDWIALGLLALVPLLMALGIASIRREARSRARLGGVRGCRPVRRAAPGRSRCVRRMARRR